MGRASAQQQPEQEQQQHDSQQAGAAPEDADKHTVDNWSEKDQRIIVGTPADGYLFDLQLHAKLDASPRQVYNLLINNDSTSVFRSVKGILYKEVLEEDGPRRRKLAVGQRAASRFLWLTIAFDTHLHVWEDDEAMTIKFTNARQDGFMRNFEGTWRVHPFTQASLDAVYQRPSPQQQQQEQEQQPSHGSGFALPLWHHIGGRSQQEQQQQEEEEPSATLVTLEQAMAPRVNPPRLLQPLVRALVGRSLQNMMTDLRVELERQATAAAANSAGGGSAT